MKKSTGYLHIVRSAGVIVALLVVQSESLWAQHFNKPCWPPRQTQNCPPAPRATLCPPQGTRPYQPSEPPAVPGEGQSADSSTNSTADNTDPQIQNQINQQPAQPQQFNNALASVDSGSRAGRAPNMIGDLFNTTGQYGAQPFVGIIGQGYLPTGSLASAPGGNVGRLKLSENTSPIPRDRYFVNYSYFNNTNLTTNSPNVNRITPGLERTFSNGNMSLEARFPLAATVDSTVIDDVPGDANNFEFGNVQLYLKALLWNDSELAFTSGLGVTLPTADNFEVNDPFGDRLLTVENESVHLLPFVGVLCTPTDRFFSQGMIQMDIDTNGNSVLIAQNYTALQPLERSVLQDRTFVFIDVAMGYWMYRNDDHNACVRGVAPVVEFHVNQSLDGGDPVNGGTVTVASPGELSVFNAVFGLSTNLGSNSNLTVGYATPVGGDEQFDGELRVMFNCLPGRSTNALSRRTGIF